MTYQEHLEYIQDVVRSKARVRPTGGGSKPALSGWGNLRLADMSEILDYNPQEFTFTALAGTTVKQVQSVLAEHGQYLPFDPPLVEAGATLGGTVASGLSGPGRFRYGGVRDFLLGVKFVSGEGQLITGGAKVVKNAAGFDFPKLMVGSLGQFGVLLELTFKVFPRPEAYKTLRLEFENLEQANSAMQHLAMSGAELSCLDFEPPTRLRLRIGGLSEALQPRLQQLQGLVKEGEIIHDDESVWQEAREFTWLKEESLVKIPISPGQVLGLEKALEGFEAPRRYSVGGNVLYLAWPHEQEKLEALLNTLGLSGLAIKGHFSRPFLGKQPDQVFTKRLLSVLDPHAKFRLSDSW
jgi:glycolate oxidase FAD binding subunit